MCDPADPAAGGKVLAHSSRLSSWSPGLTWQHQIQDHRIVVDRHGALAGPGSFIHDIDRVALLLQAALHEAGNFPIVFDNQYSHGTLVSPAI